MKILSRATAPSNIALIKYMGKVAVDTNEATNASLSYTLNHLRTLVVIQELEMGEGLQDQWHPMIDPEFPFAVNLSEHGRERFLRYFGFLKKHWQMSGCYRVSSANNFPSDCGLASSASSFAALTLATAQLAEEQEAVAASSLSMRALASLSRRGSGSSCRSFFSPWALWKGSSAEMIELPYSGLIHQAIVVESGPKKVSSSEAHRRVPTSLLFAGRDQRAQNRLDALMVAMTQQDWRGGFEICWAEFWDMHSLFETSHPSFGYLKPDSLRALEMIREYWQIHDDGPWVTMDAGANIHLLYRLDQMEMAEKIGQQMREVGKVLQS